MPTWRMNHLAPGSKSAGGCPRRNTRAFAPTSVTRPRATRRIPPSHRPTTGASFSSWNSRSRSSRVSPKCSANVSPCRT
jgi:hypothetical protein